MASQEPNKFYPASSEQMARMLGLANTDATPVAPAPAEPSVSAGPVFASAPQPEIVAEVLPTSTPGAPTATPEPVAETSKASFAKSAGKIFLAVLPYLAIFAIGMVVYYGFIADPSNRPDIFKGSPKDQPSQSSLKQAAMAGIQEQEASAYVSWISNFYFGVSDTSVIAMNTVATNKLTNFENYLLKLNPKMNDVRGTGVYDAELVLQSIDPISGGSLADWQRDAVAQYFDTDGIRARIGLTTAQGAVGVSPRVAQAGSSTPLPGTSGTGCAENRLGINTAIPGRLEVPSMDVNVPIIWTQDQKDFDTDLKRGVVHYPCTPLPGDIGTSYISGHSSNYAWIRADFNRVFARMNDLPDGATFKVTVVGQDGKDIRLHYVVQRKQIFEVDDQAQFANSADSVIALSTCWPINTNKQRMVAYGKLDRVER
jgi:LPXTG-site transpeptidase (sortase) family protein